MRKSFQLSKQLFPTIRLQRYKSHVALSMLSTAQSEALSVETHCRIRTEEAKQGSLCLQQASKES